MQHGHIEFRAHDLVHQVRLHRVHIRIVDVADVVAAVVDAGEMLVPDALLVQTRCLALGDVSVAAEKQHLIHHRRVETGFGGLQEEGLERLDTHLAVGIDGTDSSGEDVRRERLGTVGVQDIIEKRRAFIMADIIEGEGEIVVITVGGDGGVFPGILLLVHLERAGKVLRAPYHGHGNIAHEHRAHEGIPAAEVHIPKHDTDAVRHTPDVLNHLHPVPVGLGDGGGIGIHLGPGGGIAFGIDDDGKALSPGTGHQRAQQQEAGRKEYTDVFHIRDANKYRQDGAIQWLL